MEALQNAISILYNPKQFYSNQTKQEAEQYCNKVIEEHKTDYGFFFNLLEMYQDIYIQFWLLGALEVIIRQFYPGYPPELRHQLHDYYFLMLEKKPMVIFANPHMENKYSFLFILLVKADYPAYWPDAFDKLLALPNMASDIGAQFKYIDFILTTLREFDREVVELYEAKSAADCLRAKEIKEEMRNRVINDIATLIAHIIQNHAGFKEQNAVHIVVKALEVTTGLIDWANLDLFLGHLPILVQFLGIPPLQTASAKCIYSIIDKGMDPKKKLDMFDNLGLLHILNQWDPALTANEEEFGRVMAATINKIGLFLFECVTTEKTEKEVKQKAELMIPKALNMAIKVLDQDSFSISLMVTEMLTMYLSILKKSEITESHMKTLQSLFEIIVKRLIYPGWYSFDQEVDPNSMEEHYNQFRSGLTTIFTNMVEIKAIQGDIIRYVLDLLNTAKNAGPGLSVYQKEVPLYLFYNLGTAITDNTFKLDAWGKNPTDPRWAVLDQGMSIVLSMPEIFATVPLVFVGYEILVRYAGYFEAHPEMLNGILKLFTSELGIYSVQKHIASKAAHELFRFLEALKKSKVIANHFQTLLPHIKNCIQQCIENQRDLAVESLEDLYQAIGIVLAHPATSPINALSILEEYYRMHDNIIKSQAYNPKASNQMIRAMTLLIRSFESASSPELREMLIKISESIMDIVQRFTGNPTIRDSALQYFNRMIITIGIDILPQVRKVLGIVFNNLDMSAFINIMHMCHLALQTLKAAAFGFVTEMFPFLLSYTVSIGLPSGAVSDIEKTHVDAIKTFMKLIKLVSNHNVSLLFQQPLDQFNTLLGFLVSTSQSTIEDLRKTGVAVMNTLLAVSVGLSISADRLAGPTKTAKPVAFEPEYAGHATMLLQNALECAFVPIGLLNPNNPVDVQCIQDIAMLHFILYKTAASQFMEKLMGWATGVPYIENIKQGLEGMVSTGTVKEYKELLKQILLKETKLKGG